MAVAEGVVAAVVVFCVNEDSDDDSADAGDDNVEVVVVRARFKSSLVVS